MSMPTPRPQNTGVCPMTQEFLTSEKKSTIRLDGSNLMSIQEFPTGVAGGELLAWGSQHDVETVEGTSFPGPLYRISRRMPCLAVLR
jgi:hypothetical protein